VGYRGYKPWQNSSASPASEHKGIVGQSRINFSEVHAADALKKREGPPEDVQGGRGGAPFSITRLGRKSEQDQEGCEGRTLQGLPLEGPVWKRGEVGSEKSRRVGWTSILGK